MRYRLLQARNPNDPVRDEERDAFAQRLDLPAQDVIQHDLLHDPADTDAVLEGVDAVLVGGSGAYSVNDDVPWMHPFIDLLGDISSRGFPMFASCFGFQGLVLALGGTVEKDEARAEVGSFEVRLLEAGQADPLFGQLPPRFVAQLGHKDHAIRWPDALTNLAASDRCPFQAARVGQSMVYATQFHPELTRDDNLLRLRRYRREYTEQFGPEAYQAMVDSFVPSPDSSTLLARFQALLQACVAEPAQGSAIVTWEGPSGRNTTWETVDDRP